MRAPPFSNIGIVAIGRNEGVRLKACIGSFAGIIGPAVYVDSGSTDESTAVARAAGIHVVELDLSIPFTAARARNEGFRRLRELLPQVVYVQFVDSDCELVAGWLETAVTWMDGNPDVGVACGRRRERYPDASIYNMLCDIEWDTPVGATKECGGDAMVRIAAFAAANGFRGDLIAGEEPELCVRLRAAGWKIWRLDVDMTLHDAAIKRFSQWWKRAMRSGFALAQGVDLHGAPPERYCVRQSRSVWFWGAGVPIVAAGIAGLAGLWAFAFLLIYPLQIARMASRGGRSVRENWWHAGFLLLGKFPELLGQIRFLVYRYLGGKPRLIEYK